MRFLLALVSGLGLLSGAALADETGKKDAAPPKVGEKAPEFVLKDLDGKQVKLSSLIAKGPAILVVLRGYPGYQCPLCSRQVAEFFSKAKEFRDAGVPVLMVYPGTGVDLNDRAQEFLKNKDVPEGFQVLVDRDYEFANAWKLRWDAPRETAYPSTFLIGKDGTIKYARISKTHGDRASSAEVLKRLAESRTAE